MALSPAQAPSIICPRNYYKDRQKTWMQQGAVKLQLISGGLYDGWYGANFTRPFLLAGLGNLANDGSPTSIPLSKVTPIAVAKQSTYSNLLIQFFWAMCLANAQDYPDANGNDVNNNGNTIYPSKDGTGAPTNTAFQRYMQKYIGDYNQAGGLWTTNYHELLLGVNDAANFWTEAATNVGTEPDTYQRFLKLKRDMFKDNGGELFAPPGWYLFAPPATNQDAYGDLWRTYVADGAVSNPLTFLTVEIDTDRNGVASPSADFDNATLAFSLESGVGSYLYNTQFFDVGNNARIAAGAKNFYPVAGVRSQGTGLLRISLRDSSSVHPDVVLNNITLGNVLMTTQAFTPAGIDFGTYHANYDTLVFGIGADAGHLVEQTIDLTGVFAAGIGGYFRDFGCSITSVSQHVGIGLGIDNSGTVVDLVGNFTGATVTGQLTLTKMWSFFASVAIVLTGSPLPLTGIPIGGDTTGTLTSVGVVLGEQYTIGIDLNLLFSPVDGSTPLLINATAGIGVDHATNICDPVIADKAAG